MIMHFILADQASHGSHCALVLSCSAAMRLSRPCLASLTFWMTAALEQLHNVAAVAAAYLLQVLAKAGASGLCRWYSTIALLCLARLMVSNW